MQRNGDLRPVQLTIGVGRQGGDCCSMAVSIKISIKTWQLWRHPPLAPRPHLKSIICCTCSSRRSSSTSSWDALAGQPERNRRPAGGGVRGRLVAVKRGVAERHTNRHARQQRRQRSRSKAASSRALPLAGPPPSLSTGEASARSLAFRMLVSALSLAAEGERWAPAASAFAAASSEAPIVPPAPPQVPPPTPTLL